MFRDKCRNQMKILKTKYKDYLFALVFEKLSSVFLILKNKIDNNVRMFKSKWKKYSYVRLMFHGVTKYF